MSTGGPSADFLDWWFSPWRIGGPALPAQCSSDLARRDAYRDWCAQAGVPAALPTQADWRWQEALSNDASVLLAAAELFGGLLAARRHRHEALAALAPPRRRWCLAVALTQPLADWCEADAATASPRQHGLLEFAVRAERGLPGLWSRLALMVPEPVRPAWTPGLGAGAQLRERDRRCWLMCLQQARRAGAMPEDCSKETACTTSA